MSGQTSYPRIVLALLICVLVVAPLYMMIAVSLKADEQQVLLDFGSWRAFWIWPWQISFENYRAVLFD